MKNEMYEAGDRVEYVNMMPGQRLENGMLGTVVTESESHIAVLVRWDNTNELWLSAKHNLKKVAKETPKQPMTKREFSGKITNVEIHHNYRVTMPHPARIIQNGETTIAYFNDGSKVVSRPSKEDKLDPYVGWCVSIVGRLFGSKKRAKQFYSANVIVSKQKRKAPAPQPETDIGEMDERECENCSSSEECWFGDPCKDCYGKNCWAPQELKQIHCASDGDDAGPEEVETPPVYGEITPQHLMIMSTEEAGSMGFTHRCENCTYANLNEDSKICRPCYTTITVNKMPVNWKSTVQPENEE